MDPERAHSWALRHPRMLAPLARTPVGEPVTLLGLEFPNRVGLAAGYDKDAVAWRSLARFGFGHIEVGTVTPEPQAGNERPRVFRLKEDRALINRLGFPSEGADAVAERLVDPRPEIVLGVSIGPNGFDDPDQAGADYERLVDRFAPLADYLAVNVSSPNTMGLRSLQENDHLGRLLRRVTSRRDAQRRRVPLVVKLSPDLDPGDVSSALATTEEAGVDGVILTNTTVDRPHLVSESGSKPGGLSGSPLAARALEMLERVRALTSLPIIASGGIMSVDDARRRLDAGAALVQLYTGFVYSGPKLVRDIARL